MCIFFLISFLVCELGYCLQHKISIQIFLIGNSIQLVAIKFVHSCDTKNWWSRETVKHKRYHVIEL
ncbi:hypothetical protein KSS87_017315 [Heliosperma pusillum]|nr:hypothetical protein KSS87_017315 [Heliosperma pusillum]